MKGHGSKFELKKDEAVLALLTSRNVEEAAKSVGIDATTLMRWMKEPEFDAAYREAKKAAFAQTIARLHQMASAAASTLGKVMVDPSSPASTRVRAAECILNHTMKAVELEDIEARITQLERDAEASGKR